MTKNIIVIAGLVGLLTVVSPAAETSVGESPVKVSVAVVEVQLDKNVQFGLDALRTADPTCSGSSGMGLSECEVSDLVEELLKLDGSSLSLSGVIHSITSRHDHIEVGDGKSGRLRISVSPSISSQGEVILALSQTTEKVIGYKRKHRYGKKRFSRRKPILSRQRLETTFSVPAETTAIIGGLIQKCPKHRSETLLLVKPVIEK